MRITGGKAKGVKLISPKHSNIRPMMERVRKALFDIVGNNLKNKKVLDLFCGTGALGIEALSREAKEVIFVDQNPKSLELTKKNLQKVHLGGSYCLIKGKLPQYLKKLKKWAPFDIIFITPPYGTQLALRMLKTLEPWMLAPNTLVIVEERKTEKLPLDTKLLSLEEERKYGETILFFYRRKKDVFS